MVKSPGSYSETLRGSRISFLNFEGGPNLGTQSPKVLYPVVLVPLLHHAVFKCSISYLVRNQTQKILARVNQKKIKNSSKTYMT